MNIKNLVTLLVVGVLILSVGIVAVACTGEDAATDDEGQTTTTTATTTTTTTQNGGNENPENPGDAKPTYKVTVVDQDGNPVEGAFVQLCNGDLCKMPVATDANGVVTIMADPAAYTVKIPTVPAGYAEDTTVYSFEGESTELTVTLTKQ